MDPLMEILKNDAPLPEWLTAPPHTIIHYDMDTEMLRHLRAHGNLTDVLRRALSAYLDAYEPIPAPFIAVKGQLESLYPEKCWWSLSHDLASRLAGLDGEFADHLRTACRAFLASPPAPDAEEEVPPDLDENSFVAAAVEGDVDEDPPVAVDEVAPSDIECSW